MTDCNMCETCNTYVKHRRPRVSFSISLSCFLQFLSLQHEEQFGTCFSFKTIIYTLSIFCHFYFWFCLSQNRVIYHSQVKSFISYFGEKEIVREEKVAKKSENDTVFLNYVEAFEQNAIDGYQQCNIQVRRSIQGLSIILLF